MHGANESTDMEDEESIELEDSLDLKKLKFKIDDIIKIGILLLGICLDIWGVFILRKL